MHSEKSVISLSWPFVPWRSRSQLGWTSAIVFGDLICFPAKRLIGGLRLYFLALQLHPIARLDIGRVAGERVNLLVFFVDEGHPALSRDNTTRDRSLFRIVND